HRALAWALALAAAVALVRLLRRWRREHVALRDEHAERLVDSPWLLLERVRLYHLLSLLGVGGVLAFALRYPPLVPLVASALLLTTLRLCERRRERALREAGDRAAAAPLLCALIIGATTLLGAPHAARADHDDGRFDAIVAPQNKPQSVPSSAASPSLLPGLDQIKVNVPLARFDRAYRALVDRLDTRRADRNAPALLYAESSYEGRAERGHLRLRLSLRVVLGRENVYKRVPLIGASAALIAATADGRPIGVTNERGYHVWHTARTGEVKLELTAIVAPRGPRGSIEYDVAVVRTPVTRVRVRFPKGALQPRIDGAVRAEVKHPEKRSTELSAALSPTTRLHLLGFRDLGAGGTRRARVFAESVNLLSLEPGRRELFSVIRYTILYAGARAFSVALPEGMRLVSAAGSGGLRTTVTRSADGQRVLRGETAYAIKGRYELSLRLRHSDAKGAGEDGSAKAVTQRFEAPLPRCLEVERQSGWLAVEVPGTLELREVGRQNIAPVDVRQLPDALVRSAVAPILAAYRFDDTERRVTFATRRLPEQRLASEAVDRMRVFTVMAGDGRALHEIRLTLRNRTRRSISLAPPPGFKLRSAHLDGRPVQASVDDEGRVVLPLSRSRHGERLTLHVVFASQVDALGWLGTRALELPRVSLAISSLVWTVFAPPRNIYGALSVRGGSQTLYGHLRWQRPAVSGNADAGDDAQSAGAVGAVNTTQADLDASSG
ncbi:MAG: hypothetical protein KC503_26625, partial [Myxococcales bacterium]|nr:hypothetical protein [Myxococcales bacterium]